MNKNRFIGVDLAWAPDRNHTGIAVLQRSGKGAELVVCSEELHKLEAVRDFILEHSSTNAVVAVDAPLILKNQHGQRPCETRIGERFGRYDASAHSANLTKMPDPGGVTLVSWLVSAGVMHAPNPAEDRRRSGRWVFEVYPHPAHVVLFGLKRIIKYKKGRVAERRKGLAAFRSYIRTCLTRLTPRLIPNDLLERLLADDLERLKGKALKHYEDTLDAVFCAYLAFFYWYWGGERNEMIGDLQTGYIINPLLRWAHGELIEN